MVGRILCNGLCNASAAFEPRGKVQLRPHLCRETGMPIAIQSSDELEQLRTRLRKMTDAQLAVSAKLREVCAGTRNVLRCSSGSCWWRVRSGYGGIRRRGDNCSCALAKGEPEEGGFPGRAFEEGLRLSIRSVVRLSNVVSECLLPQSIFALYQREARLRDSRALRQDSRSLREDSPSLCERERSVVSPMFAESGSKNRLSQASQR